MPRRAQGSGRPTANWNTAEPREQDGVWASSVRYLRPGLLTRNWVLTSSQIADTELRALLAAGFTAGSAKTERWQVSLVLPRRQFQATCWAPVGRFLGKLWENPQVHWAWLETRRPRVPVWAPASLGRRPRAFRLPQRNAKHRAGRINRGIYPRAHCSFKCQSH